MGRLTVKFQAIVKHSKDAVNNTDIFSVIFKNGALLNVSLKIALVFFRERRYFLSL